jgi:hypothetical protein
MYLTAIIIYLVIGFITAFIEFFTNDGSKIKFFDVINFLFWIILIPFDKGKLYKWLHPNSD